MAKYSFSFSLVIRLAEAVETPTGAAWLVAGACCTENGSGELAEEGAAEEEEEEELMQDDPALVGLELVAVVATVFMRKN